MNDPLSPRLQRFAIVFIVLVYLHNTLPYLTMMPRVNVDEPWLMERAYEVMQTGRPFQPMYGESHHPYIVQAGYPYLLAGWMEVFGVGLRQARLLGIVLGLGILLFTATLGRHVIGAAGGLAAALFLAADSNFLGGVRNARTDIPSVFFAAAALGCYAVARDRPQSRGWSFASGACAGFAMMCHGNAFWVGVVLVIWLAFDHGRLAAVRAQTRWIAAGLTSVLGPFLAVVLLNWSEVVRQVTVHSADRLPGINPRFVIQQMWLEADRYRNWYFGLVTNTVPNPLLRVFQAAVLAGLIVLLARVVAATKRGGDGSGEPLVLILVASTVILFAAFINNKVPVYLPHLLIGFSLAAGLAVAQAAAAVKRASAVLVLVFIFLYGSAAIAYYEKWYSTVRKSELVPYEQTAQTLRALVPGGAKYLYASPHFWAIFYDDPGTTFMSYAAGPADGHEKPTFLLVDESQWLADMNGPASDRSMRQRWVAFIEHSCTVDGEALGTAYGTIALYRCDPVRAPPVRASRIVGGTTAYRVAEPVSSFSAADLMKWTRYDDPRRRPADRAEVTLVADGLRIAGTGWPGVVTDYPAAPGEAYLVRVEAADTHDGDLLYLGTWKARQVLSLCGAASSGMPTPLSHERWFPGDRAFIATAPRVQLLIYSEAPQTDFVVSSVTIYRLRAESRAAD